jgi:hypothetical protein
LTGGKGNKGERGLPVRYAFPRQHPNIE